MVEVAVGWVKEELFVPELVAKLDRPGLGTGGLFPEGKLLCEAHCEFFKRWNARLEVVDFLVEEFKGQQGMRNSNFIFRMRHV